ncbi:MAG: Dabb family protein [Candidatus Protistobacter heckmanni]|nr:Dabb family protein [Candidatus Protistobacter heckmanni]
MIKHIVMWNLRGDSPAQKEAAILHVKTAFEGLRGRIPGMRHLEIGVDDSGVDYACDVVLYSEFDSREALQAYASHPEHLRVREELGGVRIARFQVDYEASAL